MPTPRYPSARPAREYIPAEILAEEAGDEIPPEPVSPASLAETVARLREDARPRSCPACEGAGTGNEWRHDPACVVRPR